MLVNYFRKKYPCSNCDYQATAKGNLAKHQRIVHEWVKYPCGKYEYQATTNTTVADVNIKQLIKYISLNTKGQYMKESNTPCCKYEYIAATKESLTDHQRAVHEGVKNPCGNCDYQATAKGNLGKHQRAVHERVKYPLRQMWIQSNYEEKSDWSPMVSSWRSQKPLR